MTDKAPRKASHTRRFAVGDPIFLEGDDTREMFVVRKGRVRIFRKTGDSELTLAELGVGESFGELLIQHMQAPPPTIASNRADLPPEMDQVMQRWKSKFGPQVYEAAANLIDIPYDANLEEVIFQGEPLKKLNGSPIMKTIQTIIETVGGEDAST